MRLSIFVASVRLIAVTLAIAALPVFAAQAISTRNDAIEAAKKYVRARCTTEAPCRFRPEKDGNRWRVWVDLTKKGARPYQGGHIVLYFDREGNLIRRIEGD